MVLVRRRRCCLKTNDILVLVKTSRVGAGLVKITVSLGGRQMGIDPNRVRSHVCTYTGYRSEEVGWLPSRGVQRRSKQGAHYSVCEGN